MISVEHLTVEFAAKPLFTDASFVINDRDRVALTGKNGAGKSTLLKIIASQQPPTSGTVAVPRGTTVGYLPQVMNLSSDRTVMEETLLAFDHIHDLQEEIEQMKEEMAARSDYESEEYMALVERYSHAEDHFQMMGGLNFQAEVERTLLGLGFERAEFNRPTSELSGGWRMRIELAKLLLRQPDVLLLDEPTNHLDINSIQWLEQYLQQRAGAVVLVSHDRAFINNVTNRTLEISCGRVWDYKVKYDEYVQLRMERREQQLRAYENQQKEIADLKEFIERFRYKPTKAVQVQERIKQLNRIVPIEVDDIDNSALHLKFPPCQRSGDFPLIIEELAKSYRPTPNPSRQGGERASAELVRGQGSLPSRGSEGNSGLTECQSAQSDRSISPMQRTDNLEGSYVIAHVNLTIRRGEKVAFVGRNGEGKSTLVKCILGEIPFEGSLKVGHNAQIGYFAQNQAQLLDPELTVFDTIDRVARGDIRMKIRDILGAFMFGGEASDKKVKVLSGGERSRLAMIKLLLEPVNFLILDEPTNHLDMKSKDVLKEAIAAFDGTVIVVSHDRQFLDGLVERVYSFGGGKVREHIGGIYDWLKGAPLSSPVGDTTPSSSSSKTTEAPSGAVRGASASSSWEAQKAAARQRKKLEKAVCESEEKVAQLEAALHLLEDKMATPEGATDTTLYEKYTRFKQQLVAAEEEWMTASETLAAITS